MKFKLIGIGLIIFGLMAPIGASFAESKKVNIPSSFVYQAIGKYKQKNYTGCIQDMDYIIKEGRPTDIAYYYKAISYAQLGMPTEAREAYEAAKKITSNRVLYDYVTQAIGCMDDPSTCDTNLDDSDITKFIKSNQFVHSDVQTNFQNKAIEKAKTEINNNVKPDEINMQYLNMNNQPTDKEIADAVRTFSKLGINPFMGGGNMMYQNPEIMQMNALLGNQNNNNNNMMNLLPMLSSNQGGNSNVNKEFVQAFMLNQMLPGLNFGSNDK